MNSGNENSLTLIDSRGGVTMIDFESPRSADEEPRHTCLALVDAIRVTPQ